jgi:fructoselysine-6-P-deglycase FrlB-like protein
MVDLVRAQRVAAALAHRRGLDSDQPRALTRAVHLP